MKVFRSYKFRIYPTQTQEETLFRTIGCARKVYNLILGEYQELYSQFKDGSLEEKEYRKKRKAISPASLKQEYTFLNDVDSLSLTYSKKDCNQAYQNFFSGRSGFPKFKSRNTSAWSYRTCRSSRGARNLRLEKGGKLKLPKIPELVKIAIHRNPKGTLVSATVTKERSGKWFVSLNYEQHKPAPKKTLIPTSPVGLDMGIKDLLTTSDGDAVANLKHAYREKKKLAKIDRSLSRKRERAKELGVPLSECKNYQKTKQQRACVYEKVRNRRKDYLHKATSNIVNTHDFIAVETLSSSNLVKNSRLSYAISDVSWNKFSTFLKYKAERSGKTVHFVDPFFASTQICSACGEKNGPKGAGQLSVRQWECQSCGSYHNRDTNAAKNILFQGLLEYLSITIGTMGEEDINLLRSLVNNGSAEPSSQEKFINQKLLLAND